VLASFCCHQLAICVQALLYGFATAAMIFDDVVACQALLMSTLFHSFCLTTLKMTDHPTHVPCLHWSPLLCSQSPAAASVTSACFGGPVNRTRVRLSQQ